MSHYDYSLWTKTTCDGTRYFWIVDEVNEDDEQTIDSGIENTEAEALAKVRRYVPDACNP
ncbi:hypothetical protein [Nitrospira sp. BLG_2]|uniref:hypothetical protein n=1 Tax=Nitrospira sp. BLG_2 TaxID=3397507 RepID=UPI003B9E2F70